MGLDALERTDPGAAVNSPDQKKKGANKVAVGALSVGVVGVIIAVSGDRRSNTNPSNSLPDYLQGQRNRVLSVDELLDSGSPPRAIGSQLPAGSLQSQIDAGRAELRSLESRLRSMKSDLDLLEGELSGYKAEIERQESNARLGLFVNEYGYRAALNSYNALVPQYNLQLQTYNSRYTEYQRVLNRTNQLIDQYNAGQRR